MTPDYEIFGMFIATWGMIVPLYFLIGEVKSHIKLCPLCRKAIAEKELKEARGDLSGVLKSFGKIEDKKEKDKEHMRSLKVIADSYHHGREGE